MGRFHRALANDRRKPGVRHDEEDDEKPCGVNNMFGEENHSCFDLLTQQSCHEGSSFFQLRLKSFKIENENSFRKIGKNNRSKDSL